MELAHRKYLIGGGSECIEVFLSAPYQLEGQSRCDVRITDCEEEIEMTGVAGADELQAIQLSIFLIERELDLLKKKYGDTLDLGKHTFTMCER